MNKYFKLITLFALPSVLLGCIGGGGALTTQSAPLVAQSFMSTLTQNIPKGNQAVAMPSGVNGMSAGATRATPNCHTVDPSSDLNNADADWIVKYKKVTLNCTDANDGSVTFSHTGTYTVKDLDDNVAGIKGGYEYTYDIPKWNFITTGSKSWGSYLGSHWGFGTDTSTTFKSKMKGHQGAEFNTVKWGDVKTDYDYEYSYNITYTHTATTYGSNWGSGSMNGYGTYSVNGTFMPRGEEALIKGDTPLVTGQAEMIWEAVDLKYDSSQCTQNFYYSGYYRMKDLAGNILRIIYHCDQPYEIFLNDEKVEYH